jgi:hypothetical protein
MTEKDCEAFVVSSSEHCEKQSGAIPCVIQTQFSVTICIRADTRIKRENKFKGASCSQSYGPKDMIFSYV